MVSVLPLTLAVAPDGSPLTATLVSAALDGVVTAVYVVELPCCTVRLEGVTESATTGAVLLQFWMAARTFRRPPDRTLPASVATGSTLFRIAALRPAVDSPAHAGAERINAAAPDTCGVAMDVPL